MANEVYIDLSAGITWTDTGGDEDLDLGSLAALTGVRVGSYHDWGVDPRPGLYMMEIKIDGFDTSAVIGETIDTYIYEGQTTSFFSGPESPSDTTDGAGNVNRLPNLIGPLPVAVWSTTAADNIVAYRYFTSFARYLGPVVHNATADALLGTSDAHVITIYPAAWQQQ